MDSHVFRLVGTELCALLSGSRIEKIYNPLPDLTLFHCYKNGKKFHLTLRTGLHPSIFFSYATLPNPIKPAPYVMRLRKYIARLLLKDSWLDFTNRQIVFPIYKEGILKDESLLLDLKNGPSIVKNIPPPSLPAWPEKNSIQQLCKNADGDKSHQSVAAIWEHYPLLTPLLRETLLFLDYPDAMALLVDLKDGGGDLQVYGHKKEVPSFYCAWPLPEPILRKKNLVPIDIVGSDLEKKLLQRQTQIPFFDDSDQRIFTSLISSAVDEQQLLTDYALAITKQKIIPVNKRSKRIEKTLFKLEEEKKRLTLLCSMHAVAKNIQAVLWQYPQNFCAENIYFSNETKPSTSTLNPKLTLKENMLHMFSLAAKGKRGLAIIKERQKLLEMERDAPQEDLVVFDQIKSKKAEQKNNTAIARFVSCNGYVMLRGKNAKGNKEVIKAGQPYDYWLHAKDGPSAHLVIRRVHCDDAVPEETLMEAARLVAEKSWKKNDTTVHVMLCLLRHVHSIKGAPPGTVRVDKILMHLHT